MPRYEELRPSTTCYDPLLKCDNVLNGSDNEEITLEPLKKLTSAVQEKTERLDKSKKKLYFDETLLEKREREKARTRELLKQQRLIKLEQQRKEKIKAIESWYEKERELLNKQESEDFNTFADKQIIYKTIKKPNGFYFQIIPEKVQIEMQPIFKSSVLQDDPTLLNDLDDIIGTAERFEK